MEQDYNNNGLKNLNPNYFWQNVLIKQEKSLPTFLIKSNDNIDEILNIIKPFTKRNKVIIELRNTEVNIGYIFGVTYRLEGQIEGNQRDKSWANIDYLMDFTDNLEDKLKAGLSGVKLLTNTRDLREHLENSKVLKSVDRVNNFEATKAVLDNLLKV